MIRNTLAFVPQFWHTGGLAKWLSYLSLSNAATSSNLIGCSFLKSHVTVIVKEEGGRGGRVTGRERQQGCANVKVQ